MNKMSHSFIANFKIVFVFICLSFMVSCNVPKVSTYRPIKSGDVFTTDKMELQISKIFITMMADSHDLRIDYNLPIESDSLYFVVLGQIKNISPSAISFIDNVNSKLLFDGKFEYNVQIEPKKNLQNIVPLSTESFVLYVSVPKEMISSTENFEYRIDLQKEIDKSKGHVCIPGKNDLYNSPENIVNFHTFSEQIVRLSANYDVLELSKIDEENQLLIFSWNDSLSVSVPNISTDNSMYNTYKNRSFTVQPQLWLSYNLFSNGTQDSSYGAIQFMIDKTRTLGVCQVKMITISSENGSSFSSKWDLITHDDVSKVYVETITFSTKQQIEFLIKAMTGVDPDIVYNVEDAARDYNDMDIVINKKCGPGLGNAINSILDFYSSCPSVHLEK